MYTFSFSTFLLYLQVIKKVTVLVAQAENSNNFVQQPNHKVKMCSYKNGKHREAGYMKDYKNINAMFHIIIKCNIKENFKVNLCLLKSTVVFNSQDIHI